MNIVPLADRALSEALSLVREVFPFEGEFNEIPASLHPEQYGNFFSETGILPGLRYWVALNSGEVAGIVGLYNYQTDPQDTVWLGWFCVKPAVRRRGIGTELLRFAVEEARKRGKHFWKIERWFRGAPCLSSGYLWRGPNGEARINEDSGLLLYKIGDLSYNQKD